MGGYSAVVLEEESSGGGLLQETEVVKTGSSGHGVGPPGYWAKQEESHTETTPALSPEDRSTNCSASTTPQSTEEAAVGRLEAPRGVMPEAANGEAEENIVAETLELPVSRQHMGFQ